MLASLLLGSVWGVLVGVLITLSVAMTGDGVITIDVNSFHEGWVELILVAGLVAVYPWITWRLHG